MWKAKRSLQQHAGWDESMQSQQLVPVDKVFQKHVSRESPHMVPLLHLSNVGRRVGGRRGMLAVNSQDRGDEALLTADQWTADPVLTQDEAKRVSTTDFARLCPLYCTSPGGLVLLTTSYKPPGWGGQNVETWWLCLWFRGNQTETCLSWECTVYSVTRSNSWTRSQFHKSSQTLYFLLHTRGWSCHPPCWQGFHSRWY